MDQLRVDEIQTPRYLYESTLARGEFLNTRGKEGRVNSCFLEITIYWYYFCTPLTGCIIQLN